MWVVLTFGISCSFSFQHATESSFPFREVLVMSNAVGGRWNGRKNWFLLLYSIKRNLKKQKCRMSTVISQDLLMHRGVIVMSLYPTMLHGQQVSNRKQKEIDQWQGGWIAICIHPQLSKSPVLLFFSFLLKAKTMHKACTKLNMMGFYTTGINGLAM